MPNFSLTDLQACAVVAHDAGAANQLLSWIVAGDIKAADFRFCLSGPALDIARRSGLSATTDPLDEVLNGCDCLIAGTGWSTDLEKRAMHAAAGHDIPVLAVFDHWVNYSIRIDWNGKRLPVSVILVADHYAQEKVQAELPGIPVMQLPDRYLQSQTAQIGSLSAINVNVLFLMEPVRVQWPGVSGAGEFFAFHYFYRNRIRLGIPPDARIVIRPHPSDAEGKYDDLVRDNPHTVVEQDRTLAEQITAAFIVVGLQSYAMVVALGAGRRVVSVLPPEAPEAVLPHSEIEYLRDLCP